MLRVRSAVALFVGLFIGVACGGDSTGVGVRDVASIALTVPGPTLSLGATQLISARFMNASGNVIDGVANVSWRSSDSRIATVDQSGSVRGGALGGPVTITVSAGGTSASTSVLVVPDHITFAPAVATLAVGTTVQLSGVVGDFAGASIPSAAPIAWASSNTSVATVDAVTGLVTAVSAGDVVISAASSGRTSGLHIEIGVPSAIDGTWAGSASCANCATPTAYPVTFTVVFAKVRTFSETMPTVSCPGGSPTLTPAVSATLSAVISNNQFSFVASPSGAGAVTISGVFGDAASMTGSQTSMTFTSTCGSTFTSLFVTIPATTFSAVKR